MEINNVMDKEINGQNFKFQKPARILFFDGNCGLCKRSVRLLFKFDKHERIHCAPLQGLTSRKSLPEKFREVSNISTVVYLKEDHGTQRLYTRSYAVCAVMIEIGGISRILGKTLLIIPVFLREGAYQIIAKCRNILFPARTCPLLKQEHKIRLLDWPLISCNMEQEKDESDFYLGTTSIGNVMTIILVIIPVCFLVIMNVLNVWTGVIIGILV